MAVEHPPQAACLEVEDDQTGLTGVGQIGMAAVKAEIVDEALLGGGRLEWVDLAHDVRGEIDLDELGAAGQGAAPMPGAPLSTTQRSPSGPIRMALTATKARAGSSPSVQAFQAASGNGTALPSRHSPSSIPCSGTGAGTARTAGRPGTG
ncbi:hypothetical protein ACRBEV_03725 [Methylobacterium phyllosphaerae]